MLKYDAKEFLFPLRQLQAYAELVIYTTLSKSFVEQILE